MHDIQISHGRNALHATLCSYLGLSTRDLAEIGGFSERFARDLVAGRRPFPRDTANALEQLSRDLEIFAEAMSADFEDGVRVAYVYRTNEQLRASLVGQVWPARGKSEGGFVGPYRAALFNAWQTVKDRGVEVDLVFASTP